MICFQALVFLDKEQLLVMSQHMQVQIYFISDQSDRNATDTSPYSQLYPLVFSDFESKTFCLKNPKKKILPK
jgi:hypothetical protein